MQHLKNIFEVCKRTPETKHWMPTREVKFLKDNGPGRTVPTNLIIRISSHMIDQGPVKHWPWTSTVVTSGRTCPAPEQGNECKELQGMLGQGPRLMLHMVNTNVLSGDTLNITPNSGSAPGCKLASLQALKQKSTSRPTLSQRLKLQARVPSASIFKNQGTSAQAHGPGCKQQE